MPAVEPSRNINREVAAGGAADEATAAGIMIGFVA